MEHRDELLNIARLALEGKNSDVRLYLAKLVRRARRTEPDYANKLEGLLKIEPARSNNFLRRLPRDGGDALSVEGMPFLREYKSEEGRKPILDSSLGGQIEQILLERKHSELLKDKGLEPTSSIIFQGPPGVGKTMTANWLASRLGLPLFVLDLTAVMSSLLGKTGSNLRSVLDFAKSQPCILFLDEVDAIAKRRTDESDVGELKRLVNILLQEVENWPSQGLLIAATNHPELIDPALWRRFDSNITFGKPSESKTREIIVDFLGSDYKDFSKWVDIIADGAKGESYSEIKRIINQMKKVKAINPNGLENFIYDYIVKKLENLTRQEKISYAVKMVTDYSYPIQRASKLFGVSRDTIRKRVN